MSGPAFAPNPFPALRVCVDAGQLATLRRSAQDKANQGRSSEAPSPQLLDRVQDLRDNDVDVADPAALERELTGLARHNDGHVNAFEQDLIAQTVKTAGLRVESRGDAVNLFQFGALTPQSSAADVESAFTAARTNLDALSRQTKAAAEEVLFGGSPDRLRALQQGGQRRQMHQIGERLRQVAGDQPDLARFVEALQRYMGSVGAEGTRGTGGGVPSVDDLKRLAASVAPGLKDDCEKLLLAVRRVDWANRHADRAQGDFPSASFAATYARERAQGDRDHAYAVIDLGPGHPQGQFRVVQFPEGDFPRLEKQAQEAGSPIMKVYSHDKGEMQVASKPLPGHHGFGGTLFDSERGLDPTFLTMDARGRAARNEVAVKVGAAAKAVLSEHLDKAIRQVAAICDAPPEQQIGTFAAMLEGASDAQVAKSLSVLAGRTVGTDEVARMRTAITDLKARLQGGLPAAERPAAVGLCLAASGIVGLTVSMRAQMQNLEAGKEQALKGMLMFAGGNLLKRYDNEGFRDEVFDRVGFAKLPRDHFPPKGLDTDEAILGRAMGGGFASNAEMIFVQSQEDRDDVEPFIGVMVDVVSAAASLGTKALGGWLAVGAEQVIGAVTAHDEVRQARDEANQLAVEAVAGLAGVDQANQAREKAQQKEDGLGAKVLVNALGGVADEVVNGTEMLGRFEKVLAGGLTEGARIAADDPMSEGDVLLKLGKNLAGGTVGELAGKTRIGPVASNVTGKGLDVTEAQVRKLEDPEPSGPAAVPVPGVAEPRP